MTELPERPAPPPFSSSLPEIEPLPRPHTVLLSALLVAAAAVTHVWITAVSLADSSRIRAELVKSLGDEAPDFSAEDVKNAANVLFGVANGLGVVLLLIVIYNVNAVLSKRISGRTGLTVTVLLFAPVAVVNLILRAGGQGDLLATGGYIVALLLAVLLLFLPAVSAWLRQLERTYRIAMDPSVREPRPQATSD